MSPSRGDNADFHLLDEIVCDVIPGPAAPPPGTPVGRGENAGVHAQWEMVHDASKKESWIEIALRQPFARCSPEEQERLLSAIRDVLAGGGELRVVNRPSRT
jgi:hypothetical protein